METMEQVEPGDTGMVQAVTGRSPRITPTQQMFIDSLCEALGTFVEAGALEQYTS